VRVSPLRFEIIEQRSIDPFRSLFIRADFMDVGIGTIKLLALRSTATVCAFKAFWMMEKITVQVPASTSNRGPGFDCLVWPCVFTTLSRSRAGRASVVAHS